MTVNEGKKGKGNRSSISSCNGMVKCMVHTAVASVISVSINRSSRNMVRVLQVAA